MRKKIGKKKAKTKKKDNKNSRPDFFVAIDTEQSSFLPPTKGRQFKLVKKTKQDHKKEKNENLTFADAAEKVLIEYADKKPMHFKDITREALENKWIISRGLTPEATLLAWIGLDNKKRTARGEMKRFYAAGNGYYGLINWQASGPEMKIEQRNKEVKKNLLEKIRALSPKTFENIIGELLSRMGFDNIEVTKFYNDGGVDVRGEIVVANTIRIDMKVQVKKWRANVGVRTIRELIGVLNPGQHGLIVTTSGFARAVIKEANDPRKISIALINGSQLVELMVEYNMGIVRDKKTNKISLDKEWLLRKEDV